MDSQKLSRIEPFPPFEPSLSALQTKATVQNLSKASKKISKMNILIIEKLSTIVNEYYHSMQKLQNYYQQIQTLIAYNKSLIEVLGLFEEQEQKLLARLRKMEEFNFEYMKEYCSVKGRDFKMLNVASYNSIFYNINLQDFSFACPKIEPPVVDLNYKTELMGIIKSCFLTSQEDLSAKIDSRMENEQSQTAKAQLAVIKEMVEQYNNSLQTYNNDEGKFFQLLKLRSQIRKKLQQFYDKDKQGDIKPNYTQQQLMIDRIINLHSKLQDMHQDAILQYLKQEKQIRNSLERQRAQLQQKIMERYKKLEMKNDENKSQLIEIRKVKTDLENQLNQLKMNYQTEVSNLSEEIESKTLKMKELSQQVQTLTKKQKQSQEEIQKLTLQNAKLKRQLELLNIRVQKQEKEVQAEHKPNFGYMRWDIFKSQRAANMIIHQTVQKLQDQIRQLEFHMIDEVQVTNKLREDIMKYQQQKKLIENLAMMVYQSISLCTRLDVNQQIKAKLFTIRDKLQEMIDGYEQRMEWNILKEAPDFFKDLSITKNFDKVNKFDSDIEGRQIEFKKGYSVDQENLGVIQDLINNMEPNIEPPPKSQFLQIPCESIIHPIVDKNSIVPKVFQLKFPQQQELASLDYSQLSDNRDDYDNLYKLYQQSIQCLQMQEKKSKNMQIQYQKYVNIIHRKERENPQKYSLEKQLVYLTKLTLDQKQTIETQRKQYNEIFKDFQQEFKNRIASELRSLKSASFDAKANKVSEREEGNRSEIL